METTGQLALGLVQAVERGTGALIGYAFTVANERGQLQRWLLHRPPHNDFEIHPPPPDKAGWTLADFQASVPLLWKPGSYYVWAQADLYRHGGTYNGVTWTHLPAAGAVPEPTYPPVPGDLQLDPTPNKPVSAFQETSVGLVYSMGGLENASSVEYWVLSPGFQPAGGASNVVVTAGTATVPSFQGFLDAASRLWSQGSVLAVTGCVNYTGVKAPTTP
jgi:hypothetical protein